MIAKTTSIWSGPLFTLPLALTLIGCPDPKAPVEVGTNCKTNLETANAQFKACAAGGDENCTGLLKDLDQLGTLNPANKPSTDEAKKHVDACKDKGEADADCGAINSELAKLKCEG